MNTSLTVKSARKLLGYLVDPDDDNSPRFLPFLNRACEALLYSGKWVGSIIQVVFDSSSGFITLSRDHLAVLGGQYQNVPVPTFTQFAEYVEGGHGQLDETLGVLLTSLYDMGDGFCTQADITDTGTLRVKITDPNDAGQTVRLFGLDEDGVEIYEDGKRGVELTLADPSADTTQQFSKITGIQADSLAGAWSLWVVVSAVETQIGTYQPNETMPRYRRYKTGTTTEAIRVICQRRFIPMSEDSDPVFPGNINALTYAFKAMMNEDTDEDDRVELNWGRAYKKLNEEAKASRGGAQPQIQIDNWGDKQPLPWGN